MRRFIWQITVFLAIVIGIVIAINLLTQTTVQVAETEIGAADLNSFDLQNEIIAVQDENYIFYPEKLYNPDDFTSLSIEPGIPADAEWREERKQVDYGTYRTVLSLPSGITYGFSMRSMDYSQSLYINGQQQRPVGQVGDSGSSTIPATGFYTYVCTPQEDEVEIIIQYANFNHQEGGGPYPLYISEYHNMEQGNSRSTIRTSIIIGCMLTIFIFYTGMYVFFDRKTYFIYFALCCLSISLRTSLTGNKLFRILVPDLSWYTAFDLEYLALIVMITSFVLFVNVMFGKILHRYALYFLAAVNTIYILLVLFTRPILYTRLLPYYHIAHIGLAVYLLYRLARHIRHNRPEHILLYIGAILFVVSSLVEIFVHQNTIYSTVGLTQLGMMVFIFVNMIAIAMQFSRTETQLHQSRQKEMELEKLNALKNDFLSDISHEMKTPLTVMSGFAQLSVRELKQLGIPEEIEQDLTMISTEARRLAQLVSQLLQVTSIRETVTEKRPTDIGRLIEEITGLYQPVMEKKGNRLTLSAEGGPYVLPVKPDMMTQVILNLLTNANRYTKAGEIMITLSGQEDGLLVQVADNGSGIKSDQLEAIFERFQKDSSDTTGLGLSICREILDAHGGRIWAENRKEGGALISFILPWEDDNHETDYFIGRRQSKYRKNK